MKKIQTTPRPLQIISRDSHQFFEALRKRTAVDAVADLAQTITDPPTQAEVQAISDKVDELLAALRAVELMDT